MDINQMTPATGRTLAEDGSVVNIVDILNTSGIAPVDDTVYDIEQYSPRSGRILGEDGKAYNLVELLENSGGGGGGIDEFAFVPNRQNQVAVLNSDGTWTATADGFVQRSATITHPSTTFAIFRLYQNGVVAWANEHAGLLSTGLYEFTSETIPVISGDVITTESSGGGIASTLYFMPPRGVVAPALLIDAAPVENSHNLVRSGGVFAAIRTAQGQVENLIIESTNDEELTISEGSVVILPGGGFYAFETNIVVDSSSLDVGNAFTLGQNYYLYICKTGNNVTVLASLDKSAPDGFDQTNSRKLGGFHYGVNRRNTSAPGNVFNGILPRSVWTHAHRPKCVPEGMVYLSGGVWVDIYLSSDDGAGGTQSVFDVLPLSGIESLNWYVANTRLAAVGKRMLSYQEFIQAAAGSPPGTGSGNQNAWSSAGDRAATGFVTNAVSNIGCRDCVGNLWEWLGDIVASGIGENPAWFNPMSALDQGQMWINAENDFRAILAGGSYFNGALIGARSACTQFSPWTSNPSFGVRGACVSL